VSYLIIDIETIPDESAEPPVMDERTIKFGNTKDPVKKQVIINQAKEDFKKGLTKKMSIDNNYARMLSIGGMLVDNNGDEIERFCYYGKDSDKEILIKFKTFILVNYSNSFSFVGWNSKGFDLPMIQKRSILNGNRMWDQQTFKKLVAKYQDNSIDLMPEWNFPNQYGNLSNACKALGIECKTGLDGSKIYEAWKNGEEEKIKEYNFSDCEATLEIFKRMYL